MGSTLATLRTDVKILLNNDDSFTDVNLNIHINASFKFHHGIVSDALEDILIITDFIDVVADTREYNLSAVKTSSRVPAQVKNVKYLANLSGLIDYYDLKLESQQDRDDFSLQGIPETYEVIGSQIVLGSLPSETLTNGLKVRFVPVPTDLSLDTSTVDDIFNGHGDTCIKYYAVMLAKIQEETWDPGTAASRAFKGIYEDFVLRFKNGLQNRTHEDDEVEPAFGDEY